MNYDCVKCPHCWLPWKDHPHPGCVRDDGKCRVAPILDPESVDIGILKSIRANVKDSAELAELLAPVFGMEIAYDLAECV